MPEKPVKDLSKTWSKDLRNASSAKQQGQEFWHQAPEGGVNKYYLSSWTAIWNYSIWSSTSNPALSESLCRPFLKDPYRSKKQHCSHQLKCQHRCCSWQVAPRVEIPGDKVETQNCWVWAVYRTLLSKSATIYPITIQNIRFERWKIKWWTMGKGLPLTPKALPGPSRSCLTQHWSMMYWGTTVGLST